jgi:hypothetical protein
MRTVSRGGGQSFWVKVDATHRVSTSSCIYIQFLKRFWPKEFAKFSILFFRPTHVHFAMKGLAIGKKLGNRPSCFIAPKFPRSRTFFVQMKNGKDILGAPTSIQTTVLPCRIVTRVPCWSLRVVAIQVKGRRRASDWASRSPDGIPDQFIGHVWESHEVGPIPWTHNTLTRRAFWSDECKRIAITESVKLIRFSLGRAGSKGSRRSRSSSWPQARGWRPSTSAATWSMSQLVVVDSTSYYS